MPITDKGYIFRKIMREGSIGTDWTGYRDGNDPYPGRSAMDAYTSASGHESELMALLDEFGVDMRDYKPTILHTRNRPRRRF